MKTLFGKGSERFTTRCFFAHTVSDNQLSEPTISYKAVQLKSDLMVTSQQ